MWQAIWQLGDQWCHSAIHKAIGPLVTGNFQNAASRNGLRGAPTHNQWTLFCSTGIVPVNVMEWLGTMSPAALCF